jgi:AAA family ATP:ADP antiporter
MREAFRYLCNSKYLLSLALIVISYNIVINLVEVIWKHEVNELYPDKNAYNIYMNQVSTVVAIIATLSALFISSNSIRKFGWTFTAMLTPAILMITSIAFFSFIFVNEYFPGVEILITGFTPLAMVVFAGTFQNVFCRAAKYSVFDATKEMAFVPLPSECKLKGKAAIDGVCSRLGKTGGSLIHQSLIFSLDGFTKCAPFVAGILLGIITLWIMAVRIMGVKFAELTGSKPEPAGNAANPLLVEEQNAVLPSPQEELQGPQASMPQAAAN